MRALSVAVLIAAAGCRGNAQAPVKVTLDPSATHQTIRGWSCNPWYAGIAPRLRDQLLDEAINQLGLTRVRWQQAVGNRATERSWEPVNDDGDPDHINPPAFATEDADKRIEIWVVPFKQRVEANGEPFELWMSPSFFNGGSTGSVPAWLLQSPGEYAEFAIAYLLHMKQKYGIEATHYVICNEAGNNNAFSPAVVAEMTKTLEARLAAAGLQTKGQFPDCVNAQQTWRYIEAVKDDADFWKYVQLLTYHWYGGNNQQFMPLIRDFALSRGLPTGQTEFMGLTMNHLYDDLTLGGVSYWSIYGLAGPGPGGHNFRLDLGNTWFARGPQFWNFRQVMHYVRPGAVRIDATSDEPAIRPLAFVHGGKTTVVLINNTPPAQARTVTVGDLPPGQYGVCHSIGTSPYHEDGVRAGDGSLTVDVPANGVLTIYPYAGANLPPTVTAWEAKPRFLTTPADRVTLSAAAQDPELDTLSFAWAVTSQPPGANAALAAPTSATTAATELTVPGQYVFTVTIADGKSRVARDVVLNVYAGNQPPVIVDVHNRLPVMVTLPQTTTELRGGIMDLEGDPLTFRWSIVQQPQGADAKLEAPTEGKCKLSNLTVPGGYVFRFEVSDPTHTVAETLTVPVYPLNNAPAIATIAATPAALSLPASTTSLTAQTSDPDSDVISHWWRVRAAPPGATPAFAKQGGRDTTVSGLAQPGTYVFSLTVVDRTKSAVKDVTVTVNGAGAAAPAAQGAADPPDTWTKNERVISARGTVVGTVTAKGAAWIEVQSQTGKTARYIPQWVGGMPAAGGGPEAQIVQAIARLNVGDRVTVKWYVNDHLRIEDLQPLR
jgi:O-glycosyl hydrolase